MPLVDTLTRLGVAKAWRDGKECCGDPLALTHRWLSDIVLQPCSILARQISRAAPRYSAKGHHIFHITARSRLLSVTESIELPPRPKGGQYVKYQQIQYWRLARAPGIAADLFCAAGRRCDAYSVVVHLGGPPPSAQANSSFAPMKQTQS